MLHLISYDLTFMIHYPIDEIPFINCHSTFLLLPPIFKAMTASLLKFAQWARINWSLLFVPTDLKCYCVHL